MCFNPTWCDLMVAKRLAALPRWRRTVQYFCATWAATCSMTAALGVVISFKNRKIVLRFTRAEWRIMIAVMASFGFFWAS
jgi:hypothetical protein